MYGILLHPRERRKTSLAHIYTAKQNTAWDLSLMLRSNVINCLLSSQFKTVPSYSRLIRKKIPWAIQKRAWDQDHTTQDCGLAKHFSSLYYLTVWISSQRLCLYRWKETVKKQERLLWLTKIPPLNKYSRLFYRCQAKCSISYPVSSAKQSCPGFQHESLPVL